MDLVHKSTQSHNEDDVNSKLIDLFFEFYNLKYKLKFELSNED